MDNQRWKSSRLSKVLLPTTVTEQGSEAPEAMGVTHVGTTKETLDAGVAGEFGAVVALTLQPAARIANSKVVFVLLIREAFPIFKLPNQFGEERLLFEHFTRHTDIRRPVLVFISIRDCALESVENGGIPLVTRACTKRPISLGYYCIQCRRKSCGTQT